MDCNYKEFIPECVELNDGSLKIIKTPTDNPNYYFPSYQRKGDLYQKPNTERVHKQSWYDVRNIFLLFNTLMQKNIGIVNYNCNDTLDCFFERKSVEDLK